MYLASGSYLESDWRNKGLRISISNKWLYHLSIIIFSKWNIFAFIRRSVRSSVFERLHDFDKWIIMFWEGSEEEELPLDQLRFWPSFADCLHTTTTTTTTTTSTREPVLDLLRSLLDSTVLMEGPTKKSLFKTSFLWMLVRFKNFCPLLTPSFMPTCTSCDATWFFKRYDLFIFCLLDDDERRF
jgi:hypothetical protein